ncbi:MAG TPA: TetR/AcrR family transcriptional regulator [Vicinamibacterales bacterium]|jgi:AcrR family transcriptional regulator
MRNGRSDGLNRVGRRSAATAAVTAGAAARYKQPGTPPARTAGTPLRSKRVDICRTAAEIFRERGFAATSVSDVARALGMTKAGLYHYFESKEALLLEIMTYGLERVRDEVVLPARTILDPEERLREIAMRHARIATDGKGAVAHLGDEVRALPPAARRQIEERSRLYFDLVRDTLRELKTAGRLRPVDPTVAAFSVLGMILWLPRWFRQNGRLSQERVAVEIANLAVGGLVLPRRSGGKARGSKAAKPVRFRRDRDT